MKKYNVEIIYIFILGDNVSRRNKIILIVLLSSIFTYIIYFSNRDNRINILALGDGIASGETNTGTDGLSYNYYLKEILNNNVCYYNDYYSFKNNKLDKFLKLLINNDNNLEQLIYKANIITIAFGEEELSEFISLDKVHTLLNNYSELLYRIRGITDAKIFIISLYKNKYINNSYVIIMNSELNNMCNKYLCQVIPINYSTSEEYIDYNVHKAIAKDIINFL